IFALAIWWVLDRATRKSALGRSGAGRALYDQMRGFHRYLTTAEADQIRFEEHDEQADVFSRYLPFAIAFGVAERWAQLFAQLQAEGGVRVHTGWYAGERPGAVTDLGSLGSSMSNLASTVSATAGS